MSWRKTIQPEAASDWRSTIKPESQEESLTNTALTKFASGGGFGLDDELAGTLSFLGRAAGFEHVGGKLKDIGLPEGGWDPTIDLDTLKNAYNQERQKTLALKEKMAQESPVLSALAETAGALAVPAGGATTFTGRTAMAAGQGALSGFGNSTADDAQGLLEDSAIGFGLGGIMNTGVEKVAAPILRKGGQLASNRISKLRDSVDSGSITSLKKVGRILHNIPEDYTERYLAQKGNIEARSAEEIMDELVSHYNRAESGLENTQMAFTKSKEALSNVEENLRNQMRDQKFALQGKVRSAKDAADEAFQLQKEELFRKQQEAQNQFQDTKFSLRNRAYDAKAALDDVFQQQKEALKSKNLQHLRGDITDSINYLKEQVSKGSADAYKILESQPGVLSLGTAKEAIDNGINSLMINGSPVSDSAVSSLANLSKLKERLKSLGDEITFPQAKQIMQQLDKDIDYGMKAGEFSPEADAVKRQVRSILDKIVKEQVPAYREQMLQVAKNASLLSRASDSFGDEARTISRLNQLDSDRGAVDADLLRELGGVSKDDFATPVQDYLKTQELLGTPSKLQAYKESLPEYQKYSQLQNQLDTLLNPAVSRTIGESLTPSQLQKLRESLPEHQTYAQLQAELDKMMDPAYARNLQNASELQDAIKAFEASELALKAAKDNYDIFRNVSPMQVQSKMKAVTGARQYGADNLFGKINEATRKNYTQEIKDRALLDSFTNADTNGSRKTLLGTVLGKAAGAAIGGVTGYAVGDNAGAAAGAVAGFSLDKYAGRVFKAMLDGKIGADKAMQTLGPKVGKYGKVLMDAASRGNASLAATHFLLSQQDPGYRNMMQNLEQDK